MDFTVFDTKNMDEYVKQAKERWGNTAEYRESEQKALNRSKEENRIVQENLMQIFGDFGKLKDSDPKAPAVQDQVRKLQDYITEHFYKCSDEVLYGLGKMYASGGDFTTNIDEAGGVGTAEYVFRAIQIYCKK